MYDVILITTHYNYREDGSVLPEDPENFQDSTFVVPLGIMSIAQYLHDLGFKVQVVHIPHELYKIKMTGISNNRSKNPIEEILRSYPARVCGIQAHWYCYCGGAVYVSNLYKKLFPESRIFLGGYMATACWNEFLDISRSIDGVVLGEGEKIFAKIVEKALTSRNGNFNDIRGLASRGKNGRFVYNSHSVQDILNIKEIPIIHPQAAPFKNIIWDRYLYINIARGLCQEKCSYCVAHNKDINKRSYQTLNLDRVLKQIDIYEKYGVSEVFLGESHFLNLKFMDELVSNVIKENLNLSFKLETHPVMFEKKSFAKKLFRAKFFRYTMGCESGADSLLKRIGRNSSAKQIIASVKKITENGGVVSTSWISNLPGETKTEFNKTQQVLRAVVKAGGFIYWIENLHVLPGSEFYKNSRKWNIRILLNNLEDWIRWSTISKSYIDFENIRREPLQYLTHLNGDTSPGEMVNRLHSNRKLALMSVPDMKINLIKRFRNVPDEVMKLELSELNWYREKGWKLLLF